MTDAQMRFAKAATPAIREFLIAAEAYCATARPPLTRGSLSSILFDAGRQIDRLIEGCDITTGRLSQAWARLRALEAGGPRTRRRKSRATPGASDAR